MMGIGRASVLLLPFTVVHICIYSKLGFSIKTLPSNLLSCLTDQKERRFWLIPVNCGGFPLCLFESAKSIDLGLIPSRINFGTQMRLTALASLCWVLLWVLPQSFVLPGVVILGTDGEGWGRGITFVLYPGSHTHISKTKFFNQNSTFKFIELLDRPEKEKILTDSCELWGIPIAPVCCCIWKWRSSDSPLVLG